MFLVFVDRTNFNTMKGLYLFISMLFISSAFSQREGRIAGGYSGSAVYSGFRYPGKTGSGGVSVKTNMREISSRGNTSNGLKVYDADVKRRSEIRTTETITGSGTGVQKTSTYYRRIHTHSLSADPVKTGSERAVHSSVTFRTPQTFNSGSLSQVFAPLSREDQVNKKIDELVLNQDMRQIVLAESAARNNGNCDHLLERLRNAKDLTAAEIRLLILAYQNCMNIQNMLYSRISRLPMGGSVIRICGGRFF